MFKQKRLAVLDQAVGVFQVGLALADRLHLGAAQRNSGLEFLEEKVVMPGCRLCVASRSPLATGSRGFAGLVAGWRVFPGGDNNVAALAGTSRRILESPILAFERKPDFWQRSFARMMKRFRQAFGRERLRFAATRLIVAIRLVATELAAVRPLAIAPSSLVQLSTLGQSSSLEQYG
jgi:hypothetical protein